MTDARPPLSAYSHHRAFVGQPARYDLAAGSQFALLFLLGLREHHRLLDFGCGSLRLGRLAIPYLMPDRYCGIEPETRLVEEGFQHELGIDIRALKRPRFDDNKDYSADVFGETFDFIVAQSVFSHMGQEPTKKALGAFSGALAPGGLILANWLLGYEDAGANVETADWVYPECVAYMPDRIVRLAEEAGLAITACPWPHPELNWFVMARQAEDLPSRDHLKALRIAPPDWQQ